MVVAADRRQARQVMRFVRGLLSAPVLAKRVVNDTADSIELAGATPSWAQRRFRPAAATYVFRKRRPSPLSSTDRTVDLGKARVDVRSVTTAVLDLAKLSFFGALRPCVIGVEACGSAHLKGVVRD